MQLHDLGARETSDATLAVQSGLVIWLLGLLTAELMLSHHTINQVISAFLGACSLVLASCNTLAH